MLANMQAADFCRHKEDLYREGDKANVVWWESSFFLLLVPKCFWYLTNKFAWMYLSHKIMCQIMDVHAQLLNDSHVRNVHVKIQQGGKRDLGWKPITVIDRSKWPLRCTGMCSWLACCACVCACVGMLSPSPPPSPTLPALELNTALLSFVT